MTDTELPAGLTAYKQTSVFDQDSLPAGLRREHRTKAGVWALIHVVEGSLRYRIPDGTCGGLSSAGAGPV